MSLPLEFALGLEQFERGEFFAAHETWERLWLKTTGPERVLVQGLVQAAAARHLRDQGRFVGWERMRSRALAKLEPFGVAWCGFDVARVAQALRA